MSTLQIPTLICPVCQSSLERTGTQVTCTNEHNFPQTSPTLNLTYPAELSGNDALYFEQYKQIAQHYDMAAQQLFAMHGEEEQSTRAAMIDELGLQPGDRVLEISVGTGANTPFVLNAIGDGEYVALDLSPNMLAVAQDKFADRTNIRYVLANASYLPFPADYFDAIIHVGGINTFTEKKRAVDEMQRVVKVGGKILISDEGMGPWNLETEFGRKLLRVNGLYRDQPPLDLLPVNVENIQLNWVMGNAFYVLQWNKRADEPYFQPPQ